MTTHPPASAQELKPCPFCGCELDAQWNRPNPKARCRTDGCKGKQLPVLNLDVPEDIDAWNQRAPLSKLRAPVADERAAVDSCGYVAVKRSAVDWLKDKFPLLTIKAGLCERIGGRLYTITRLMIDHDAALASAPVAVLSDEDIREVFLAHGFTIKEGQTDLKPYVYEAARALIAVARIASDADKALAGYAARESAPVAGEAIGYIRTSEVGKSTWLIKGLTFRTVQDHKADPTGETWTRVYAAPQASEAEQSIIAAFLERSGQWLTNDAITTAARNAALEEAAVACKESSMMNVDSYCGATASMCADRIRSLKNRAALSAQPGAQKEK